MLRTIILPENFVHGRYRSGEQVEVDEQTLEQWARYHKVFPTVVKGPPLTDTQGIGDGGSTSVPTPPFSLSEQGSPEDILKVKLPQNVRWKTHGSGEVVEMARYDAMALEKTIHMPLTIVTGTESNETLPKGESEDEMSPDSPLQSSKRDAKGDTNAPTAKGASEPEAGPPSKGKSPSK
jgi:hypothetical protein